MPDVNEPNPLELAALAQHGGAFDWLSDEPDLYTDEDGEPVAAPRGISSPPAIDGSRPN
jgi:hypothetical protein